MLLNKYKVGIISGSSGAECKDKIAMQQSFGRISDEIAKLFSKCYISLSIFPDEGTKDYVIESDNVELIAQPKWSNTFQGVRHPVGILKAAKKVIDFSDVIFVRGTMPYLPLIYLYAIFRRKPVVQWMAGDLLESLRWYPEAKSFNGRIRSLFAWLDEKWFKFIRKSSLVYMITSGCALYEKYQSPRTTLVVSSTIKKNEFYYRKDTCQNNLVRILFVGFVRPGKGLKYLIDALAKLKTTREFELAIVGGGEGLPVEKTCTDEQIERLGLTSKISWEGYARFGPKLFDQLKRSDLLVLPTLSEGAPHVLIEARAFGLPVISTWVGGIPSSVEDGKDGILVAPRDSEALAKAIDRVIDDDDFRKELISNGYATAERFSLENFIDKLKKVFTEALRTVDNANLDERSSE